MFKKDVFKKIILEFHKTQIRSFVLRDLKLPTKIDKVITLYGARRCGKTYLFYQTIQELYSQKVELEKVLYINFEDERILPFTTEDLDLLLDAYFELYPEYLNQKIYLFLDEIQEIPFWEKFVRRLSEKGNFQIFLTGSSSKLFAKDIATSLRGRTISYFLMPLGFKEFLLFNNFKIEKNIEHSPSRHKLKKLYYEYLKFGGFPEVISKEETYKTQILQEYFELIFYKDLVERYKIRNFYIMKELMRYLLANFSALFSMTGYYNLLKSTNQKIGKDTLFEYLFYLDEINFIKLVPLFDFSLKKQMINPKKVYCIDTGLVTATSFQFSENKGKYLENLVFLELLRRGKEIYYFKDKQGKEIDFLVVEKNKPKQLIQVCTSLETPKVEEREITPLLNTAPDFDIKECLILTDEDEKREINKNNLKIKVQPVWQWLLEI